MRIRSSSPTPNGRQSANPHPKNSGFRLGRASEAHIPKPAGLRAEMMVGVPAIISDLDAHPELKSHRGNGGMRR
eukprot:6387249-Lingulodinium_polyedra.AAC.1